MSDFVIYTSYIFSTLTKMSEMKNLKERKFILPSSFRDFSPWLIDSMGWRPSVKQATWFESRQKKIASVIVGG